MARSIVVDTDESGHSRYLILAPYATATNPAVTGGAFHVQAVVFDLTNAGSIRDALDYWDANH